MRGGIGFDDGAFGRYIVNYELRKRKGMWYVAALRQAQDRAAVARGGAAAKSCG
jgi:hypothetical protein